MTANRPEGYLGSTTVVPARLNKHRPCHSKHRRPAKSNGNFTQSNNLPNAPRPTQKAFGWISRALAVRLLRYEREMLERVFVDGPIAR